MKSITVKILITFALLVSTNVIAQEKLHIEGSTTVGPVADGFAEAFKSMYPDTAITVNKSGSGTGATALIDGRCDIATMSRFMKDTEFKDAVAKGVFPVAHAIAMDGICVVVHPSNPINALTTEQVRDIYIGKITNWKQLGGPDTQIVVISRDTESGTYDTFETFIMKSQKMASNVEYVNSNPQMFARVQSTSGAVGYVGFGFVKTGVKALTVNGVKPSVQTIISGQYSLSRPLYMFTNGYPKLGSMTHKFVTFHLTEKGQEVIEDKGFVALTNY
ncbi:MAG: phosphate ABC transporter substrate-binding protein [Sedimentisphaerales bacterium]|nr:phosphate ABC transporter substrate-binding protein [Sedimentisphaerales bacterium]